MDQPRATWRVRESRASRQGFERFVRTAQTATLVGHLVFVWGGIRGEDAHPTTHVFIFNSVSNAWKAMPVHSSSNGGAFQLLFSHTATLVDDSIFFIGGVAGEEEENSPDVFILDLLTMKLSRTVTLGQPKQLHIAYHTADLLPESDEIIVLAGELEQAANSSFLPNPLFAFHAKTNKWRCLRWQGKFPPPRANHASCFVTLKLYIFGGFTRELGVLNDLHILDFASNPPTFSQPNVGWEPLARYGTALVNMQGRLFLFGGKGSAQVHTMETRLNDLLYFDLAKESWINVASWKFEHRPSPRSNHRALAFQNRILIFGGTHIPLNQLLEITLE